MAAATVGTPAPEPPGPLRGGWIWLFPLGYALHLAEEYLGGESFPGWISRVAGVDFTRTEFLRVNAVAFLLMVSAVILAGRVRFLRWLVATLGFIVLFNGAAHTVGSIVTRSYSPGAISGLLVWVPLGLFALRRCRRELSRGELAFGVAAGIVAHAIIAFVAFSD